MKKSIIPRIRAFNRFYTDIIGLFNHHLLGSSYSLTEARIMYEIFSAESIQASQIMSTMHIDKSYLSRLLKTLEKNGIIVRKPSSHDARAFQISLSEKGIKEFELLNNASDLQIKKLTQPLSDEQCRALGQYMRAIMEILESKERQNNRMIEETNKSMKIRTVLLPGDLGYVAYLHGWLYGKELGYRLNFEGYVLEGLQEFAKQYDANKDRVWVCEDKQKIVGFLMGLCREGEIIQLRYFILHPDYRGLGLGKQLMDQFMTYMRDYGYKRAFLWTTNEQGAAISLYKHYGFYLTEEKDSHAFGKTLIEQRYDLDLT